MLYYTQGESFSHEANERTHDKRHEQNSNLFETLFPNFLLLY